MGLSRACLLFVFHFTTVFSADLTSQCQCPENINCGNSATVRCNFSEDVYTLAKSFIVVKFPINATANEGGEDIVVYCSAVNKALDCEVEDGYKLHPEAGLTQTLHIATATTKDEGRYACQYLTSKPQKFQTCTLRVQEANIQDDSKTEKENSVERGGDQEKDGQGGDSSVVIIIIVVLTAAAALGIVLVLVIRRRRSRSGKKPPTNKPANVHEAEAADEKEHLVAKEPLENANFSSNEEKRTRRSAEAATPNGPVVSEETSSNVLCYQDGDLQQTPKFSNDSHHQSSESHSSVDGLPRAEKRPSTNRPASEHEAEAANGPEKKEHGDLQQTPKFSNDSHHQSSESSVDGCRNENAPQNVATRPAETLRTIEC